RMLAFPLHPRLARVVVEGERRGVGRAAASAAAVLSERDLRRAARTRLDGPRTPAHATSARSDVLERLDDLAASGPRAQEGLDPAALASLQRAVRQLGRLVDVRVPAPRKEAEREDAL